MDAPVVVGQVVQRQAPGMDQLPARGRLTSRPQPLDNPEPRRLVPVAGVQAAGHRVVPQRGVSEPADIIESETESQRLGSRPGFGRGGTLNVHRESPKRIGAPGLSGMPPAEAPALSPGVRWGSSLTL